MTRDPSPPDWRGLCEELTEFVARLTNHYYQPAELLVRARAALSQPEPEVVGPSDEELLATLDNATADFPPRHPEAEALNAVEYPLALELRKARAVLARWGRPAPAPVEAEVAELALKELERTMVLLMPVTGKNKIKRFDTIRAALKRLHELENKADLSPAPPAPKPADGEVGELVADLRMMASQAAEACQFTDAENLSRAADLLEQRQSAPVPVAVSERLPQPEDCDAEGRCWWFCFECPGEHPHWILAKEVYCDPIHCLPFHALPLPSGEVEA